ncbi:hypothetical protein WJX84_008703 [Apatococcus fuscideae]|uniref:DNA polymerase delta subunit 3 n=1 Tax=Apatococcus fuscideae TaxID=2026836 RepID=A0AAW1SPJ6_9CHLO
MSTANDDILQELEVLVGEELQVVSFKWLSRRYGLPVNLAKQLLFAFVEKHKSKAKATYLLAGWTKAEPSQHIVTLVDQDKLLKSRDALAPVTSLHVYSIQPTQPKDPAELWNVDNDQLGKLFDDMVKLSLDNCLVDNRWGSIACPEARRDPNLAVRPPIPAQPAAPSGAADRKGKTSKGGGGGIIAAIDAVAAGATGSKHGVATTSIAAGPGHRPEPAATADEPDPDVAPVAGTDAPAAQAERKPSGGSKPASAKPPSQPSRGKGKSQLANMWSKAPAKSAKGAGPAQAAIAAQSKPAADAEEALRQAQEAGSGSDSDDLPPVRQAFLRNGSQQNRPAQPLADLDSEGDEQSKPVEQAPPNNATTAARPSSKPAAKAAPARASGTSKGGKARARGAAAAPAASQGQAASRGGSKRGPAASSKSVSQQPEASGSTAGGSVAGGVSKRRRVVLEDDSSNEDDEVATERSKVDAMDEDAPAAAPAIKGRGKKSGEGKANQATKGARAKGGKAAKKVTSNPGDDELEVDIDDAGGGEEGGSQEEATESEGKRKRGTQKEKAQPKLGSAKAGAEQGAEGRKRRKVLRSTYNDKGEEVTEMVWEEDPDEPELGTAASGDTNSAALKELSGNEGQAKASTKQSQTVASKPAKDSGNSASAPRKGGKASKAAPVNQRGIMTFFGKK